MFNKKIMYILALFIIVSLSMNAFSAMDIDDLNNIQLHSSDTANIVADDEGNIILQIFTQTDYGEQDDVQSNDDLNGEQVVLQSSDNQDTVSSSNGCSTDNKISASNGTGGTSFNMSSMMGGNGSGFDMSSMMGGNGSGFDMSSMMGGNGSGFSFNLGDLFSSLFGGGKDSSNSANQTAAQVSDVPEVVTVVNYKPVSSPSIDIISQHTIKRVRDNKIISQGDTLKLEGINRLYDTNFTNGHLLVYVDNNLMFNEITADDLSTPILGIGDDLVGQHEISVEFTSNADSNSTTNKYTEKVAIS